ncbi:MULTISPECIES: hypothetical protein [Streptomyces]|uniref:Uncharacterized protein n=1 Tax=Streptomyces nondiastaticus TaxID=3154512 RepID=A0ABW6U2M3_9ACTN|nr:hypothetical protein [Streptomyces sp. VNUA116]WKU42998.1 hypothetical protein Q3V23_02325 [Streptomyces sp. VNUA116]
MGGFAAAARERVNRARAALAAAQDAADAYETAVASDELEDALRVARENGVAVESGQ